MVQYLAAAKDASMKDIAMANYALALFQTGQDQAAIKEAKQLLRRDPQFWDMRAAMVALYDPPSPSIHTTLSHNAITPDDVTSD
jgi:Flp pilus assembly protein TadD